jgi:4-hydroxybenzoyl-CoA reductase subunit beta
MLRLHEFRYLRPRTVGQAAALLREHAGSAMPIGGGTDLVPNMKHGLFAPDFVIALKGIAELRGIEVRDGALCIGPAETLTAVARSTLVQRWLPSLAKAAGSVAGPQLRNMGTLGGNLCLDTRCTYYNQTYFWRHALGFCLKKDGDACHVTKVGTKCVAAHSADTVPVLMTLGASVDLTSAGGTRTVAVDELFVADGIWNAVRRPDEIVSAVRVPLPSATTRTAFQKLRQRNAIDFPLLNVAAAGRFGAGREVEALRIVVSALGSRPRVVTGLEKVAVGARLTREVVDAVALRAYQQCHPLTNIIVDPEWRRAMVPVYVRRALDELMQPAPAAA